MDSEFFNDGQESTKLRLIYYLGAIGEPYVHQKLSILKNNLQKLAQEPGVEALELMVNAYSAFETVENEIGKWTTASKVFVHKKPGMLAELWHSNPHHGYLTQFTVSVSEKNSFVDVAKKDHNGLRTMVLFTLDDVELQHMPVKTCVQLMDSQGFDILSPRVSNATHFGVMGDFSGVPGCKGDVRWKGVPSAGKLDLKRANHCEWYCYLMSTRNFLRLLRCYSVENPCCWGTDLLLGHFNFKVGIWAGAHCHHLWKGIDRNGPKFLAMYHYLKQNGFSDPSDVMRKYPPVISVLDSGIPSGRRQPRS